MLALLLSTALAAATPICPNGVVVPSDQPCPLPAPPAQSVFFESGDARLSTEARTTLEGIAARLNVDPSLRVLILGHAQEGPDAAATERLSRARAKAVLDGLIELGVRVEQIASGAAGAARLADARESAPRNWRVEILFAQGTGPFVDASGEFLTSEGVADGSASPSAENLLAGELPFQAGFVEWEYWQRTSAAESARRAGRAGPGGSANYSGISDCAREYERLLTIVQALPTGGPREQAIAAINRANEQIAAMAAEVYQQHNYE